MKHKLSILFLLLLGAGAVTLSAQDFQLLHSFDYTDGEEPYAGLSLVGNVLLGSTSYGSPYGNGTVFDLNTDGSGFNDLHNFTYPNEASSPKAGFVVSGNTLYAAGYGGGVPQNGVIFSINSDGTGYTNLYVFGGGSDSGDPRGALVLSSNVLYGTTQGAAGGGNDDGSVFSVQTNGSNFTKLYAFGGSDGNQPYGGLVLAGNVLYGTTYTGGTANSGVIFSLTTDGKTFSVLHNFATTDGTQPVGELVLSGGTLYGTASAGGASHDGTVFSIGTNGGNFNVLHSFAGGNSDGAYPYAGLELSSNLLYGTTSGGGYSSDGTVFSIPTNGGSPTLIRSFSGATYDGGDPESPVLLVGNTLFGTTSEGGANGDGTVFSIQLSGIVFAEQPASATNLSVSNNVEFDYAGYSLDADALPELLYQWRLNGVNIPNETNYELDFTNVQPTNGGLVTIAVSDGIVAPNSSVATFAVPVLPIATNNDDFSNRLQLAGASSGVVDCDNTKATLEPGEPAILPGNPGGKSVWFSWQAPVSGTAVFTTAGSTFDTIMGVFTGTSLTSLVREPSAVSDDDSGGYLTSKVSFNCSSGHVYQIGVDGYRGASGGVVLSWQAGTAPASLPVILTAPPPMTVASNGASVTLVCQASIGTPGWYFNGQPTGIIGTNFVISSVSATNVGSYVAQVTNGGLVAATQPARLELSTLQDGSTDTNSVAEYKFLDAVSSGFGQGSSGNIVRQDGGDTRGFSVSQTFSTAGATGEPGEPNIAGQIGGSPVWYVYVSPTNGSLVVSTAGSSFNTLLGVFIGPGNSFATLTNIGAGYTTNRVLNGQPLVALPNVPKGQTNYIVVDGYHGATGTVDLSIALGTPVNITTPPQSQYAVAGSNATFSTVVSGSTPLSYYWQFAGTNITGATNSSLTITNVQAAKTGLYAILVSNMVSVASNSASLSLGTIPNITTQPVSRTVHTNTTASLSVAANGTPSPTYQWLFHGASAGSSTSALSIPNFGSADEGSYWVVVSNVLGVATSSNAILLLDSPMRVDAPSLSAGVFDLQLIGVSGSNYVLEASTNLVNWVRLETNSSPTGFINLTDTNAGNFKLRFYRTITN